MPPFNRNNFFGNAPAAYQGPQNSHEATIKRTGDSSFGYKQVAHNIGENGKWYVTGRTSGENDNNGEKWTWIYCWRDKWL